MMLLEEILKIIMIVVPFIGGALFIFYYDHWQDVFLRSSMIFNLIFVVIFILFEVAGVELISVIFKENIAIFSLLSFLMVLILSCLIYFFLDVLFYKENDLDKMEKTFYLISNILIIIFAWSYNIGKFFIYNF